MGAEKWTLHSTDPLDPRKAPLESLGTPVDPTIATGDPVEPREELPEPLGDPGDQSNAIREFRAQVAGASAPVQSWSVPPSARRRSNAIPIDVQGLREIMRLTQREFAGYFGFPIATLKHWEHGERRPTGAALVLLAVIHANPRAVLGAVRRVRSRWPELLAPIAPRKTYRAPPGIGERQPPLRPRGPRKSKRAGR